MVTQQSEIEVMKGTIGSLPLTFAQSKTKELVQIMKGQFQILSAILLLGPVYRQRGRDRPTARHLQVSLVFTTNDNNVG